MLDFVEGAKYLWFGTASPHYWNSGDFYMDDLKVYSEALERGGCAGGVSGG